MVSSNQEYSFWVLNFQSQQKEEGFDTVVTSVDIVSQEEVVGVGDFPTNFEQFNQVVELSMDVSANLNPLNVRLQVHPHLSRSTRFKISPSLSGKGF